MSVDFVPFTDAHLDAAGVLASLLSDPQVSGHVAIRGNAVEAFVLARLDDHPLFGRNAWIREAGHAGGDAELLRDVYAVAADGWFAAGHRRHYMNVPAIPGLPDPWLRLRFHHMHVDTAIRETQSSSVSPRDVTIRPGGPDDRCRTSSHRGSGRRAASGPSTTGCTG